MSAWYGPVTLTLPRSADASRRLDDHDGFIYNSWLRIPTIFCSLHLPPAATCARRHLDGNPPRRSHQTQPSGSANRGSKPRTGDTQARGGGAPPRRRGAPPPAMRPRSLLRVRISQTSSAPCNEPRASRPLSLVACPPMAALRGLSADLGIPPSSARLGSCRRWHCTGRWHCSPLALH